VKQPESDVEVFAEVTTTSSPVAAGEIVIGHIAGIDSQGQPLVEYVGNPTGQPLVAMSTMGITPGHVGRSAALLFANGDPRSPVIMGLIHSPLHDLIVAYEAQPQEQASESHEHPSGLKADEVTVDGRRVVLEGKEEVVIKCGEASITLTKAGKILIRGNYLLNRSTGVNRIMGGSVQVN
jgi:hypothetical protein